MKNLNKKKFYLQSSSGSTLVPIKSGEKILLRIFIQISNEEDKKIK